MSSTSYKNTHATVESMEELSQEHKALPEHNTANPRFDQPLTPGELIDPNLDDPIAFHPSQKPKTRTRTPKTTQSQAQAQDTSALHSETLKKVAHIMYGWLQTNIDTETMSFIVTPTPQGILLRDTPNKNINLHPNTRARARRDAYIQGLADMRSELQDAAYFEGYEDALDDVENKLFTEDFEKHLEFDSEFDADSEYESESRFDSGYADSEYEPEPEPEYEDQGSLLVDQGSLLVDTHSDPGAIYHPLSKILHEINALPEPTEADKIRLFKLTESAYERLIKEITVKTSGIRHAMSTGEVDRVLKTFPASAIEEVGGVNGFYATLEAYVLEHERFCEQLGNSLLSMRDVFTATRCEAEDPDTCECNDIRTQGLGRDVGLESSREQYSDAAGKGDGNCEGCRAVAAAKEAEAEAAANFGIFSRDANAGQTSVRDGLCSTI